MTNLNFLASAGILAPLVLFWQNIQGFIGRFLHVFWKVRMAPPVLQYRAYAELVKNSRVFTFDSYEYITGSGFSKKLGRWRDNLFRLPRLELCFYKGYMPVLVSGKNGNLQLQYLKFTFPFERFCSQLCEITNKEVFQRAEDIKLEPRGDGHSIQFLHGRSLKMTGEKTSEKSPNPMHANPISPAAPTDNSIFCSKSQSIHSKLKNHCVDWDIDDLENDNQLANKNTDKYQLTKDGKAVMDQVTRWMKARSWYETKGISWRRGMALNGDPGNGKSTLVKKVAQHLWLPLFVFDLSSMDNSEFEDHLERIRHATGIVLFEDLDNVFQGRENITKTAQFGGLTFDCLINKLSGVDGLQRKFVFITTNHIEKLDPAILRPGRIDEVICIQPLNNEEKLAMATTMLDGRVDLISEVIRQGQEDTTAEFENRCSKLALESFWGAATKT